MLGRFPGRGVALLGGLLGLVGAAQVRLGLPALAVGFDAQPLGHGTLLLGRAFQASGIGPRKRYPEAPAGTRYTMAPHSLEVLLSWRGKTAYDREGEKLGKIGDLYLDGATDLPAYAGLRTGLLGRHESIVPLAGAEERAGDVHLPFDAALVRTAPSLDPAAALDPEEEHALGEHYGRQADRVHGTEAGGTMLRSEEELRTGHTEMRPAERVRLKKVLVTEHVEQTVPRRREVIQLETEPPPAGTIESVEDVDDPPR